jgi:ACS family hexuronate transporter-like MFS transporter
MSDTATAPDAAQDRRTRNRQVLLVALIFFATALNYVDRQVLALLKPTLQTEFGWGDQQFAHLGSSFQLAAAISLIWVGWFVDRFGVRFAYGAAVAIWSLAGMAHALAASVQQFVIARIVLASAESVNTPAAIKAAALYLPMRARSVGIGFINTAPNIGAILTPLLIPPFALAFGWKAAFIATGALGFIWLPLWYWSTRGLQPASAAQGAQMNKVNWKVVLADRRSWTVIGAKGLTDLVWWFVLFWTPDFFNREFGLSQATLGGPVAFIFTLAALGAITSGGLFPILLSRGLSGERGPQAVDALLRLDRAFDAARFDRGKPLDRRIADRLRTLRASGFFDQHLRHGDRHRADFAHSHRHCFRSYCRQSHRHGDARIRRLVA